MMLRVKFALWMATVAPVAAIAATYRVKFKEVVGVQSLKHAYVRLGLLAATAAHLALVAGVLKIRP